MRGTWGCKTSVSWQSLVGINVCKTSCRAHETRQRPGSASPAVKGGGFDGAISVVSRPPESCRDAKCSSTSPRSSALAPSPSTVDACSETPSYASQVISIARTSRSSSTMPLSGPNTAMRRLQARASIWLRPRSSQIVVATYAGSIMVLLHLDGADSTRGSDICYRSQRWCYQ
jgi:hypothetical protein